MGFMIGAVRGLLQRYPVSRGMLAYSLLWPVSNVVQQALHNPTIGAYDPMQTLRFFVLGTFVTAPTVYAWVKIVGVMVKGTSLRHAMLKAFYDITLFAPFGQSQFYFSISVLEGKPIEACVQEVKDKLIPSWKVAVCFWPFVQTLNYAYVREKNRVIVVSVASIVWTMFLSYMHHSDPRALPSFLQPKTADPTKDNTRTPE